MAVVVIALFALIVGVALGVLIALALVSNAVRLPW